MRLPRLLGILLAALFFAPLAARADDTKPPVISEVKASSKGGKVSLEAKITDETGVLSAVCSYRKAGTAKFYETPMVKNDYDDTFKVSFPGGSDTEFFIATTDLLGNGPAFYGAAAKPMSVSGKAAPQAVASNDNPPPQHNEPVHHESKPPPPPPDESANNNPPPPPPAHHEARPPPEAAPAVAAPVIQHRKPSVSPPDGQDFKLRIRITSAAGIKKSVIFLRPQGYTETTYKQQIPLTSNGGESYEVVIPADIAHGTLEYFLMALDNAGQKTQLGDPDDKHWFALTFKGGADNGAGPAQPILISTYVPGKIAPGSPFHVRAQASLPTWTPEMSDQENADAETKMGTATAKILYRTQDAGDASMDMTADSSGGIGGFQADLPAQQDGAPIYYQVVVCIADQCAIDTGSKHKWNAVTATNGDATVPNPIKAVSPSAPAGLPE